MDLENLNSKKIAIILGANVATTVIVNWLYCYFFYDNTDSFTTKCRKIFFRLARKLPQIRKKIESELKKLDEDFKNDVEKRTKHLKFITSLPGQGLDDNRIMEIVSENLKGSDYDWKKGYASGSVYVCDDKLTDLVSKVYGKTSYTNPLHPDLFPGLCKMEAEVVRMALDLFHGDEESCGCMTSGGTESILMACKAYRDYAKEAKGINRPEIVVPTTIHAAFDKAAQYFGLRVRSIRVDPLTFQVDIRAMKRAINSNTIMLAGSAPNFPYGTIDDIQAISDLGIKYNIPVHVDSCLGGFLTCFMEDAGYPIPPCDFRLPGVTSISADTHKYGYTPKGSSLVLYRHPKYRHHQYTVTPDWPGGVYGSPTVCGSRAGGNIAACWATLLHYGKDRYIKITRDIVHTTKYIEKGLRRMKGIFIFGQPATSVIGIGSNDFEIYRLSDALNKLGWNLSVLQFPCGIHLCVTQMHTQAGVADRFLKDVQNSLVEIMKDPKKPVAGKMALYGVAQQLPDRSIVGDFTKLFLDALLYIPKRND